MSKEFFVRILSSAILLPFVFYFIIVGSIIFYFFVAIIFLITVYEWHFLTSKNNYYFPGFIFIMFSFYTFYFFRFESDYLIFLLILTTCIATDIGGYFFGKILKGPKLTKISPNKTYAGMFGGFVLSLITVYLFFLNLSFFRIVNTEYAFGIKIIFTVLSISLVSQIGDLIISNFKRKSKVKNTGKIIPGHGGVLDRIDGMIFAFPFSYILINLNLLS